ncbi:MAG: glycosyltransferase family 4 protein [Bacteroides sp.]|nr:glycosyltransferase family 4 protein [Bacteroides sp.]
MAKVVILGSAHPLRGGGLATFNERLARAFQDEGHEVIIYTFSLQYPGFLFPGKTQYSEDPAPEGLDIRVKVNSLSPLNWWKVGRELRKLKPDLLVVRYWIPFMAPCLGTIASMVKKNKHTRVVAIADNIIPHEKRPGDRLLTHYFVKRIQGFVTLSESVREDLMQFGVPETRSIYCAHPLYDNFGEFLPMEQARKQLGIAHKGPIVLFFGFIRDYKGLDLLLKAFASPEIKALPLKLLVAGEFYTDPEPYHELAEEFGMEEQVLWQTHFIPNEKVREYFCAANLVAQPYKSATQSGVTQVAYHFEVPMLVTRVGGLPEMVPHGKVGYVVEPEPKEISKAIAEFFKEGREKAYRENIKEEKKRFTWQKLVNALIEQGNKR